MRKIILIAITGFVCILNVNSQSFVDTAKLNRAYRDLKSLPANYEREKAFFEAFPSSWMEFILTYHWRSNMMYDLDYDHIAVLGNLKFIPDTIYCDKLIFLGVGGKWESDAPNYLQEALHKVMDKKADVFFARLSLQHRGFQLRFWQYYWSCITHPEDNLKKVSRPEYRKECELLKNKMKAKYPEEVKAMEVALSYSLGEINFLRIEDNFPHGYFK